MFLVFGLVLVLKSLHRSSPDDAIYSKSVYSSQYNLTFCPIKKRYLQHYTVEPNWGPKKQTKATTTLPVTFSRKNLILYIYTDCCEVFFSISLRGSYTGL
uniref:RxLR effector candidate protein n=1 Tax=Hyaloperonospora arabidopsidis (strain Emoy2) TaxID=559515 RepID=M4B7K3_HYAAE